MRCPLGFVLCLAAWIPVLAWGQSAPSPAVASGPGTHADAYGEQLGTVQFPVACGEPASHHVQRGVALLHHMTYEGARDAFAAATQADPECAMGYWGQAMTYIHPLWSDPPSEADFENGRTLIEQAKTRGQPTERERDYIAAAEAYYAPGWNRDETQNLARFEEAWEEVYRRYPDDPEAACFYALAHLGTADPADKTYAKQKRAGAIAEQVLTKIPDHPGAHHYCIHAYDYPPLAKQALDIARSYAEIAPAVPHALHMPTHIFTRLGLWNESVAMNERSAAAALNHPVGDHISLHYHHALDYLAYAHLQRADDREARQVLETVRQLRGPSQVELAAAYAFAAVPARFALERQQWADAARLPPRTPEDYPWDAFPAMEAITHFARALGAARSGDAAAAQASLDQLATLHQRTQELSAYWAQQIEIQRLAATAWLNYAQGETEQALETLRQAAAMEAATEKHPVTPGEVLPARELLADMLLEMGRAQEAQAEYEATLQRSPNRFNSLYGAARAASLAGNQREATAYYRKLIELTVEGETERDRLQQARAFLAEAVPGAKVPG